MTVGDMVTDRHGRSGRIIRQYDDFSACGMSCVTMSGQEWLESQEIKFTDEQLKERWFSVDINGGSIWSPESCLKQEDGE